MKTKQIISTGIAGHEHVYIFERNSRLPLSTFRKPPLLTRDEWVVLVACLCALASLVF